MDSGKNSCVVMEGLGFGWTSMELQATGLSQRCCPSACPWGLSLGALLLGSAPSFPYLHLPHYMPAQTFSSLRHTFLLHTLAWPKDRDISEQDVPGQVWECQNAASHHNRLLGGNRRKDNCFKVY